MSGVEYLSRVLNDPAADVTRRDRAAATLASIELRSGRVMTIGKKAQLQLAANDAGKNTEWGDDLRFEGKPPVVSTIDTGWEAVVRYDPHPRTVPAASPLPPDDEE